MTVYLVIFRQKYRIYTVFIWFWPTIQIFPDNLGTITTTRKTAGTYKKYRLAYNHTFVHTYRFVHVRSHLQVCTRSFTPTSLYTFVHTFRFVDVCSLLQVCTRLFTPTGLWTFVHTCRFVHKHRCMHNLTPGEQLWARAPWQNPPTQTSGGGSTWGNQLWSPCLSLWQLSW